MVEEISARNLGPLTQVGVGGVILATELTDAHYTFCIYTLGEGDRIPSAVTLII